MIPPREGAAGAGAPPVALPAYADPAPADAARYAPEDVFAAGLRHHHVSNTAYPLAHELTFAPYRVPRARHQGVVRQAFAAVRDLSVYVHVPFCEVRCAFCEYTVVKREESRDPRAYVDDLLRELDLAADALGTADKRTHGFDIGGGTPSLLGADLVGEIVARVRRHFRFAPGADVSIETTPRVAAAHPARIAAYRALGIDRISMGIQVIQPDLLRALQREGNGVAEHLAATRAIRAAGFERFNVDLMYGFAGQSPASWRATLEHAISLGPEAITLYRMRYKLTRISHQAAAVTRESVVELGELAKELLSRAGYHANPGKTTWSRDPGDVGTSSYLARRVRDGMPYLGFGLGAQSFSPTTIAYNDGAAGKTLAPYRRSLAAGRLPIQDLYRLPERHVMGKMCAVSFYFGEIDRAAFRERFGRPVEAAFPDEVDFALRHGLMTLGPRALSLTDEGARQVNGVIALFLAPSVQGLLVARDPDRAGDLRRGRSPLPAQADARA